MNIFALDMDPHCAAKFHVDKHCVKMVLETAQMVSTNVRYLGYDYGYRKTHLNHPSTKWARESCANFSWLCRLGISLCEEYTFRYGKIHKSESIIMGAMDYILKFPDGDLTPFAQAMPDQYKNECAVTAYRNYYVGEKSKLFEWNKRETPFWIENKQ